MPLTLTEAAKLFADAISEREACRLRRDRLESQLIGAEDDLRRAEAAADQARARLQDAALAS
jgi:hypothetical protein